MGRHATKGLNYFNIDCVQEDNLNYVEAKHGITGYGVLVKLWRKIYMVEGYFCDWSEKNIYLFSKEISVPVSDITEIVNTCLSEGIFHSGMFNALGILTSHGIQKRWLKIVTEAKRKECKIDEKIALSSKTPEEKAKTPEPIAKTPGVSTQRKEKEKKEKQSKEKTERVSPDGEGESVDSPHDLPALFSKLEKTKKSIVDFIRAHNPQFIEPYVAIWNIFAKENAVPAISKVTNSRLRKFKVRIQDKSFDFIKILGQAKKSEFVRTGKWFGFDWVLENETNYLKILEGNFIQGNESQQDPDKPAVKSFNQTLSYLYGRYQEGELEETLILPEYYDRMVSHGQLPVGAMEKHTGSIDEKKRSAVIALFKTKSQNEKQPQKV